MGPFRVGLLQKVFIAILLGSWLGTAAAEGPPPAGETGTISGIVIEKKSRAPIIEAGVEIVGQGKTVRTDLDGKFSVKLPPGTYELRIFAPTFQAVRLKDIKVAVGASAKADAALDPAGAAGVDVVEVDGGGFPRRQHSVEGPPESMVVEDTISREPWRKRRAATG
jgi:hypothetical protein